MVCRFIKYCLSCHPQDHPCQQYADLHIPLVSESEGEGRGNYLRKELVWYYGLIFGWCLWGHLFECVHLFEGNMVWRLKLLAKRNITGLYHKHAWEVELQSNFQACQQNPGMASVIGDLIFSCIGTMYTSRSSGNVTVFNLVSCIWEPGLRVRKCKPQSFGDTQVLPK